MTILVRPGNGLPIDSQVFLPIMMLLPMVVRLKYLRSSGSFQGNLLLRPIVLFSAIAQINARFIYVFALLSLISKFTQRMDKQLDHGADNPLQRSHQA